MTRNADSPSVDARRYAMTPAERQRRYRDRLRGGPARGRWNGHTSAAHVAREQGVSRSMLFMAACVGRYAPDLVPAIERGDLTITAAYYRRRDQLAMTIASEQLQQEKGL